MVEMFEVLTFVQNFCVKEYLLQFAELVHAQVQSWATKLNGVRMVMFWDLRARGHLPSPVLLTLSCARRCVIALEFENQRVSGSSEDRHATSPQRVRRSQQV